MMPTILILVGITGDLAQRKLLPAIARLKETGQLPEQFQLVGVSRREGVVIDGAEMVTMDLADPSHYHILGQRLAAIEKQFGKPAQRVFYLSVSPTVVLPIIGHLGESGLAKVPNTKLLLEKPFGVGLKDAEESIATISNYFSDDQIYRIDHYLAKDSVRMLAQQHIEKTDLEKVELVAYESLTIEGRADFYDKAGALRDLVQSHLLETLAFAFEPDNRLAFLKHLSADVTQVKRGQYEGYVEAVGHESATETYVSVALRSSEPVFQAVSFTLASGKALDRKVTELRLFYKNGASEIFDLGKGNNAYENVFLDAMAGDKTFFISPEEVIEDWRIVTPVQEAWQREPQDLFLYTVGSAM